MRYPASICISCLLLLFARPQAAAQRFSKPYQLFTIRDGLAQQQVRAFLEDSRGFIWIGTNSGLSRFDGRSLKPYTLQQGFPSHNIYTILEAPDGAIWYRSADAVYRFDGRTARPLPMDSTFWQAQQPYLWPLITLDIRRLLGDRYPELKTMSAAYDLIIDTAGAAIVLDWPRRMCYRILADNCVASPLPGNFSTQKIRVDVSLHYVYTQNDCYTWTNEGLQCVARYLPGKDVVECLHPMAPRVFYMNTQGQTKYWYLDQQVYKRIELDHFNRLDKIMMDSQRRLHIATDEGYGLMYPDGPEEVLLPQARYPWSILPDAQGTLWVGSYRDGLIRLNPGKAPTVFPLQGLGNVEQIFPGKLLGPDGVLLFGGYKGFFYFKENGLHRFPLAEPVEALCWDAARHCYWVAGSSIYGVDASLQHLQQTISLPPSIAKPDYGLSALALAADGSIWAAGYNGVARLSADGALLYENAAPGPGKCLQTDSTGTLWLGTQKGLFRFDHTQQQFYQVAVQLLNTPIHNLVLLPNRHLVVIADTEVFLLDIQHPENPLLKGYWSEKNGYQLLEAINNGACYDGTSLWIPAGNGIQRINLKTYLSTPLSAPVLHIDQIQNEAMPLQAVDPENAVEGHTMQVYLSWINLNAGQYTLQYSLDNGQWKPLEQAAQGTVTGLQHGQNQLRFRAKIPMMDESKWPMAACTVVAHLPFWERPVVQNTVALLGGVFLILLVVFIFEWRKKRALKDLLRQAQLGTVQAQLNPHILFNLLTSLQNSIANRSKQEASEHLVRIARLIREVLELSMAPDKESRYKFPTIKLSDEITFLKNYLHLESVQHSPPFQYTIQNDVTTDLVLPPLLVQPLVENAVVHGLRPQVGKAGLVSIHLQEEGDQLVITVTDDGNGPNGSDSGKKPLFRYRSRGQELLQERLRLIKQLGFSTAYSLQPGPAGGAVAEIRIKKML